MKLPYIPVKKTRLWLPFQKGDTGNLSFQKGKHSNVLLKTPAWNQQEAENDQQEAFASVIVPGTWGT